MKSIVKHCLWFCALAVTNSAFAVSVCESYLDGTKSTLSPEVQSKWNQFKAGLRKKPGYARNEFFLYLLSGPYRKGVRELLSAKTTMAEDREICAEVSRLIAESPKLDFDFRRFRKFYDRFCAGDKLAAERLTAAVLNEVGFNDYPRRERGQGPEREVKGASTYRWLNQMLSDNKFSPEEWFKLATQNWEPVTKRTPDGWSTSYRLGTPGAVLALADAVAGNFARLGWTSANVEKVARLLLSEGLSVDQVQNWLSLDRAQVDRLKDEFSPLQWLGDLYQRGGVNEDTPKEFRQRLQAWQTRAPMSSRLDEVYGKLLIDTKIRYSTVMAIFDAFKEDAVARGIYQSMYVSKPRAKDLSSEQLGRAIEYFGRAEMHPDELFREKEAEAKVIEATLRADLIDWLDDFHRVFNPKRFVRPDMARTDEGTAKIHAVAEVYFRVLLERLPEFMRLGPQAADVRWLLETPKKFGVSLHDDTLWRRSYLPFYRRWITPKDRVIGAGEYMTRSYIFELLNRTLATWMPRAQSMEDWLEVMNFEIAGASEYETFKRQSLSRFAIHAVRLGDERLDWIGGAEFDNDHALRMRMNTEDLQTFRVLAQLREMVPPGERSDETLMAKAVELLLSDFARHLSAVRLHDDLNHPIRRMVIALLNDGDPTPTEEVPSARLKEWEESVQESLLGYLEARVLSGAKFSLMRSQFEDFQILARARGFSIERKSEFGERIFLNLRHLVP